MPTAKRLGTKTAFGTGNGTLRQTKRTIVALVPVLRRHGVLVVALGLLRLAVVALVRVLRLRVMLGVPKPESKERGARKVARSKAGTRKVCVQLMLVWQRTDALCIQYSIESIAALLSHMLLRCRPAFPSLPARALTGRARPPLLRAACQQRRRCARLPNF